MRAWGVLLATLALVVGTSWSVSAQLGEVARRESERRKAVTVPGKVYTNDTLGPGGLAVPTTVDPSASDAPVADSSEKPDAADETTEADEQAPAAQGESYWKERMQAERDGLDRAQTFAAALQSQINGLFAEFTACDAPTQCNDIAARRQKSLGELDRVKKEVEDRAAAVEKVREDARRAGVPAGWVR